MVDLRDARHLPNNRPGRHPVNPPWLPVQRNGITPQMIGRYPDFNVFDNAHTWDDATRDLINQRMLQPAALKFFSIAEEPTYRAFCETATAQNRDPRVPVAEMVDSVLAEGKLDGYQYADMPDDRDTWHLVVRALDENAMSMYGAASFALADEDAQLAIVERFSEGTLSGGAWKELNIKHAWSVCMRMVMSALYAHPWAWNEIGFGGPAYPRGFMRLGEGDFSREPFEKPGATSEDPVPLAGGLEE